MNNLFKKHEKKELAMEAQVPTDLTFDGWCKSATDLAMWSIQENLPQIASSTYN